MDAKYPRRLTDIPLDPVEHAENILSLELVARVLERQAGVFGQARSRLRHGDFKRKVLELEHGPGGKNDRAMNNVLELAYIAGPVVFRQKIARTRRDRADLLVTLPCEFPHEVIYEERYVVTPIAKGWQMELYDI